MKRGVCLGLLISLYCFGLSLGQSPLRGKFVAEPYPSQQEEDLSYLIFEDNNRFAYHFVGYVIGKHREKLGTCEYINDSIIKVTFDPPKTLGEYLGSDPISTIIDDTIKIINRDTLLVYHLNSRIRFNEIKYIRASEK